MFDQWRIVIEAMFGTPPSRVPGTVFGLKPGLVVVHHGRTGEESRCHEEGRG